MKRVLFDILRRDTDCAIDLQIVVVRYLMILDILIASIGDKSRDFNDDGDDGRKA